MKVLKNICKGITIIVLLYVFMYNNNFHVDKINNDDFIHGNSLEFYNCEHNATKLELAYLKINKNFKDSNQKKNYYSIN